MDNFKNTVSPEEYENSKLEETKKLLLEKEKLKLYILNIKYNLRNLASKRFNMTICFLYVLFYTILFIFYKDVILYYIIIFCFVFLIELVFLNKILNKIYNYVINKINKKIELKNIDSQKVWETLPYQKLLIYVKKINKKQYIIYDNVSLQDNDYDYVNLVTKNEFYNFLYTVFKGKHITKDEMNKHLSKISEDFEKNYLEEKKFKETLSKLGV